MYMYSTGTEHCTEREQKMTISEFAASRGKQPQVISRYINRHPEDFKDHTKKTGKAVDLDDRAIEILSEKYPLPKPVTVIQGVPKEEFEELQQENRMLGRKLEASQEAYIKLLSEKQQLELQMKDLLLLEGQVEDFEKRNWFEKIRYRFKR